jgi:hypothetical protein
MGCLDTPPTPTFEKLYKVFEHLFSLKRGEGGGVDAHV